MYITLLDTGVDQSNPCSDTMAYLASLLSLNHLPEQPQPEDHKIPTMQPLLRSDHMGLVAMATITIKSCEILI